MAQTLFALLWLCLIGSAEVMAEPWRGKKAKGALLLLCVARSRAEHKSRNALGVYRRSSQSSS